MVASESVVLDALDFQLSADLAPGEALVSKKGKGVFIVNSVRRTRVTVHVFLNTFISRVPILLLRVSLFTKVGCGWVTFWRKKY